MTYEGLKAFFSDMSAAVTIMDTRGLLRWLSDSAYLRILYRLKMKRKLDLSNPKTYNEKLQWLKIHDRKSEYTLMVDKFEAKQYVADRIGQEYIVPCYGVWDSFDAIPFDELPNQFVLKTTHDCGGVVLCRNKNCFDKAAAKQKLEKHLRRNYYYGNREWPYKNVKPRIIAEQHLSDESGAGIKDYKFFCFNGEPKALFIASERQLADTETKFDFFDMDFRHLDLRNGHPNADQLPDRPKGFEEMRWLAGVLSKGIPHVRVDFYEVAGNVYFGEMTFYHWSGMVPFEPETWDRIFGEWVNLPKDEAANDY